MVLARPTGLEPAASMHDMLSDRDSEIETNEELERDYRNRETQRKKERLWNGSG